MVDITFGHLIILAAPTKTHNVIFDQLFATKPIAVGPTTKDGARGIAAVMSVAPKRLFTT